MIGNQSKTEIKYQLQTAFFVFFFFLIYNLIDSIKMDIRGSCNTMLSNECFQKLLVNVYIVIYFLSHRIDMKFPPFLLVLVSHLVPPVCK